MHVPAAADALVRGKSLESVMANYRLLSPSQIVHASAEVSKAQFLVLKREAHFDAVKSLSLPVSNASSNAATQHFLSV